MMVLPVVRYAGKYWHFDQKLRQLRNVGNPHDWLNLTYFEALYFEGVVVNGYRD